MLGTEEIEFFKANIKALSPKDQDFAHSLASQMSRGLSDKQIVWVKKLSVRMKNDGKDPAPEGIEVGNFGGVIALFNTASKNGLKYPKIRMAIQVVSINGLQQQPLSMTLAGPNSKRPGCVNVMDGGPSYDRIWFGRVTPEGVWEPSQAFSVDKPTLKCIADFLTKLAADPAKVTSEYGQLNGHCVYCNSELSDPKSKSVGYGATCAKKWGMPYGQIKCEVA